MPEIVNCADCAHCYDLFDGEALRPYSGRGDGSFYCLKLDMEFYAPDYSAVTFYCADGITKRKGESDGET